MRKKIGSALVVGAGISGIRAALDLAEFGYGVTLIDQAPHMGGVLSQLDYQFPTDGCGMCKMLPLVDRDTSSQYCLRKGLFHENIDIRLSTELVSVEGEAGQFQVSLRQTSNLVDPARCVGCGECVTVCPIDVPDTFNAGLSLRKAIYLPVPHNIPNTYLIDQMACTRCGECEAVCPTGAIRVSEQALKDFHILVVDDESIVRDSLQAWLEDEGFTVHTAASGSEALDRLSKQEYQLMLTDIVMPEMDGVELLEKAKDMFPGLCVVMMTAYATVETAVEAMKIGAIDYLLKPFDPETLVPMTLRIYQQLEAAKEPPMTVGALVLCGGTSFFDPAEGKNTYGYGIFSNVVTSLEFERMLSGTGPNRGRPVRPYDGKPLQKVAWLQCVGSRDTQIDADYCSSICCMHAIKEALVVKKKSKNEIETTIFYMDMRSFGKSFQRYRDQAENDHGVQFIKGRVHSIFQDNPRGDLVLNYVDHSGKIKEERFDMAVLSVGQRPASGTTVLADIMDLPISPWGFVQSEPFSLTLTTREGIVLGGSFSGLKDINDSVIQASAAALSASRVIHSAGGSLAPEITPEAPLSDILQEPPRVLVILCTCGDVLSTHIDTQLLVQRLKTDPAVDQVAFLEQTCTTAGWNNLIEIVEKNQPNRILIGACLPYVFVKKIRELGMRLGLDPALVEVVDINPAAQSSRLKRASLSGNEVQAFHNELLAALGMGLSRLKWADPTPGPHVQVYPKALVVGGGIAGMTSALAIADHGFQVDLIEREEQLGGNLNWLQRTLEGYSTQTILTETMLKVEKHPKIRVHTRSQVLHAVGQVGHFFSTIETRDKDPFTIEHGVTILATGGKEATTTSYHYGKSDAIITLKELEQRLNDHALDLDQLESVVMIQCVDSREEPRNYCSRVCCSAALKNARQLKAQKPEIDIYIFYRDMMTYGFVESYYTQARREGVTFIPYDRTQKPKVNVLDEAVQVVSVEPIIGKKIKIDADLVVLSTGVVPMLSKDLAQAFGANLDQDGFFKEADSKWRPVDALAEGVFACGLTLSPRNVTESIATAEAAAQRAMRILSYEKIPAGKIVAEIRHSLCSLCERCIDACPYSARIFDQEQEKIFVNAAMCQGCGSCTTACPNSASILSGFLDQQMFETIDFAMEATV